MRNTLVLNRNRKINTVSALRFEVLEIWVDFFFLVVLSLFFPHNQLATFELQYHSSGPGCPPDIPVIKFHTF